jgi:hypothetical protein
VSEETPTKRRIDPGLLVVVGVVALFTLHRVLVMLSAGDFLYPLEPSEAKNTQIAWDLMTGRFGTDGFTPGNYISNSGSIHHGSYSTGALSYWLVSRVFGYGLLSIRMVPLLFNVAAMLVWLEIVRRSLGTVAAALAGVALTLVPTLFVAFDLTFLGCHPESQLPLALTIGAWLLWLRDGGKEKRTALLLGACVGYSAIFSYLLWPLLGLMLLISFVPPLPRPGGKGVLWGAVGLLIGLWPFWLILILGGPGALFGSAITEREETTILNMATGFGLDGELYWRTLWENLPAAFHDYWMGQATAGALWGKANFELIAYRMLVFGPLLLLPWAVLEKEPVRRRLLLLVAVAPAVVYGWLCFASPWKPHVPVRYFIPFALLGFSAPAVMVGVALLRLRERSDWTRWTGLALGVVGAAALLWLTPPRFSEAADAVRLERASMVLHHRYVSYYNLGVGTVWAELVEGVNDMIDVRTAQGDPRGFDGFQAGLWGSGRRLALGEGDWEPPDLDWGSVRSGLSEWSERQSYLPEQDKDDPRTVAFNVGWGAGVRSRWNVADVARVAEEATSEGSWPQQLELALFWEGFGFGWGRAVADVPAHADSLPDFIPAEHREAVARGMRDGRALGEVPKAPRKPIFTSVRGPAT